MDRRRAMGWIAALAAAFPVVGRGGGRPEGLVHAIAMAGTRFAPAELTVSLGDTVVWINDDIVSHTATARGGAFDSGNIPPGGTWKLRPAQKGAYPYFCIIHPTMKGILRVE